MGVIQHHIKIKPKITMFAHKPSIHQCITWMQQKWFITTFHCGTCVRSYSYLFVWAFHLGLFWSIFVKFNSWKNRVFGYKISSCTDLQSHDVQCCMSSRFRKPVTTDVVSVTVIPSSCFVWQFQILILVCFLVVATTSIMRFLFRFVASQLF